MREGLYEESEGRYMDFNQRNKDQEDIKQFLECAFIDKNKLSLEDFVHFNTDKSSEMFISVMSIIHEKLPCAQFYFRQRRKFKERILAKITHSASDDKTSSRFS